MSRLPQLSRRLKREAPAWLISLIAHGVLLSVLALITWTVAGPEGAYTLSLIAPGELEAAMRRTDDTSDATTAESADQAVAPPIAQAAEALLPALPKAHAPLPQAAALPNLAPRGATSADPAAALLAALDVAAASAGGRGSPSAPGSPGKGLLKGTSGDFQGHIVGLRRRGLDVVLILDATDSMAPYIEQAKRRLHQIVGVISGLVNEESRPATRVRVGVVAFKDYGDDYGSDATKRLELTGDIAKVRRFLDGIVAGGGGDDPEPIHEALKVATSAKRMGWQRHRVNAIVLVGDAPVHAGGRAEALDLARQFTKQLGGSISTIDVGGDQRDTPLPDFVRIARTGAGSEFVLKDEQAFWRHLIVSVFGRRFEQDVQQIVDRYADP